MNVQRNRIPVPMATARRSPSRVELVRERPPIDPLTQAARYAQLSKLYVQLAAIEAIEKQVYSNVPTKEQRRLIEEYIADSDKANAERQKESDKIFAEMFGF